MTSGTMKANRKRKQNDIIAVTPPSPSSSEKASKKAKEASVKVPQLISMRIYNEQTGVSNVLQIDRPTLMPISDFFRFLVENLDEGETEIALEEEDVYEATELLMNIANFYRKEGEGGETAPPIQVLWSRSKAILTMKWLVQEYVDA